MCLQDYLQRLVEKQFDNTTSKIKQTYIGYVKQMAYNKPRKTKKILSPFLFFQKVLCTVIASLASGFLFASLKATETVDNVRQKIGKAAVTRNLNGCK